MLDLFWRTFVEDPEGQPPHQSMPQTRHQLLSAFWQERLLHSVRHKIPNLKRRIEQVVACAASSIGTFDSHALDTEALGVLLSESVVVPEGRLNPRYRFRHPLLRDFAIALWCLSAADDSAAANRWSQIKGGLQRHGALRAMFEALSDPKFAAEHPHLSRPKILAALLQSHVDAPHHIAQLLGTLDSDAAFDPALWPPFVQKILPATFGTELLASARFAGNVSWTGAVANWSLDAGWLDDGFANELLNFVSWIQQRARAEAMNSTFTQTGRAAAAKLRQASEHPRFISQFESNHRWLKMASLNQVVPLLPDEATLQWIEHEMPVASWRTREYLLEQLIHLASVDPARTAALYRAAVGLKMRDGVPVLDLSYWQSGMMDHHAIEWSLAGKDQRRSLLHEHPKAFLPVAFELAEALSMQKRASALNEPRQAGSDLVDDHPDWKFWSDVNDHEPSARCIRAIHECAEHIADTDVGLFFSDVAPLFAASRSLTIQSVYLDLLLNRVGTRLFKEALLERLLDGQLYRYSGVMYWLEAGLSVLWPDLSNEQRITILCHVDALANDTDDAGGKFRQSRFLACLPQNDLSAAHQALAAERIAEGLQPLPHPKKRFRGGAEFSVGRGSDFDEESVQGWPKEFDQDQLRILSRASRALSGSEVEEDVIREELPKAIAAAGTLLPVIAAVSKVLEEPTRFWVLDALEAILEKNHRLENATGKALPIWSFAEQCAPVALNILENTPYGISGKPARNDTASDVWFRPETLWSHALALADAALVWPPGSLNKSLQDRFERVLVDALTKGNDEVQVTVAWSVRPWHWFHTEERRELHNRLIWATPRRASVLISFLAATQYTADKNRIEIYRLLLNRDDLDHPQELAAKLGELCGHYSMRVFTDIGRSSIATLAREIIDNPDQFALIRDREARANFFRSFAFGMEEEAKDRWGSTDLATDFGNWNLKIWRLLLPIRTKRKASEGVVLFALHWHEQKEGEDRDITKLRLWWQHLLPLVYAVANEGGQPDCFTLFFNFRDHQMHHLLQPEELFDCVDSLLKRLAQGVQNGSVDLDSRDPENDVHSSWREVLQHAAEALDAIRNGGLLQNDFHREKSRELLARMAAVPFSIDAARTALYRLQNESI